MKKILSILLALGLVLGVSLSALPVGAQFGSGGADWTVVNVSVTGYVAPDFYACEFSISAYNITFNAPASLTQGFHSVSVRFPAGTGYPATWRNDHIIINGNAVFASEITQDGDVVTFLVPVTLDAGPMWVAFVRSPVTGTGLRNPATGRYNLEVKTSREPMSTWVRSGWTGTTYWGYWIMPTTSTYYWEVDFGPAYPGIAVDYVPPFKACGQDPGVEYNLQPGSDPDPNDNPFVSFADGTRWVTPFNLHLDAWPVGCQPCPNMSARIRMTGRPAGGRAHLYLDGATPAAFNFTSTTLGTAGHLFSLFATTTLANDPELVWDMGLHFDTVGTYTLCFELIYAGTGQCELGCESVIRCIEFDVKQNKDAISIPLYEKWNLISLPLVPFDSSIDAMLATLPARTAAQPRLVSIWNYDAFDKEWFVYGSGQSSLTDIVDGKSYWFRNTYTASAPSADRVYNWWVFGTEKPQPPMGPSEYPVAEGWNMVGFTSLLDYASGLYLWNWTTPPTPVIYGWTQGMWTAQGWNLRTFPGDDLQEGQGYWMAFPAGGSIFVP